MLKLDGGARTAEIVDGIQVQEASSLHYLDCVRKQFDLVFRIRLCPIIMTDGLLTRAAVRIGCHIRVLLQVDDELLVLIYLEVALVTVACVEEREFLAMLASCGYYSLIGGILSPISSHYTLVLTHFLCIQCGTHAVLVGHLIYIQL